MDRYTRQTSLPEIGEGGQERLRDARVLLVGMGGLGCPVALYLAAAGVGTLQLVDDDVVSLSNLQRQVLYTENEVGLPKVACAARRLTALNSEVRVLPYPTRITSAAEAEAMIADTDIVVDACDNFATRYLLSDACARLGKPLVYGAVSGFEGQVSVFCYGPSPRTYRDLYPDEAETNSLHPNPAVVGVTPAVVGSVQAAEVLKIICQCGEVLSGKLWIIDLRTMQTHLLTI